MIVELKTKCQGDLKEMNQIMVWHVGDNAMKDDALRLWYLGYKECHGEAVMKNCI